MGMRIYWIFHISKLITAYNQTFVFIPAGEIFAFQELLFTFPGKVKVLANTQNHKV